MITRRAFNQLALAAGLPKLALASGGETFLDELNRLVEEAYRSIPAPWRDRASIASVEDFRLTSGLPSLHTYAKLATCKRDAYPQTCRHLGVTVAKQIARVIAEVAPTGPIAVVFLKGQQWPRIDACEVEGDTLTLRGYFDFGVK